MAIPPDLLGSTCDIYRPFGAGAPTYTNVPCRLVSDMPRGNTLGGLVWTHYLVVDVAVDVQDGCTRALASPAVTYADGDEVRIAIGAATPRFVVIWVENVDVGSPREFKRAYLTRHTA
jgi:hypothetical protein